MQLHANAVLSLSQRRRMVVRVVEHGWPLAKAAEAAEVSERTCLKWGERYRVEGERGLRDRSSAPHSIPHRTPIERVEAIEALRRLRMTGADIATCLGMALSTVSAILKRRWLGGLSRIEPPEPPNRYQRRHPGELVHIDISKLGRIRGPVTASPPAGPGQKKTRRNGRRVGVAGWEFVHVARSGRATCARAPTGPAPTARPSASYLPCSPRLGLRTDLRLQRRTHRGP